MSETHSTKIIPLGDFKGADLTGKRFGRLFVIGMVVKGSKRGQSKWLCRCDCGGETVAIPSNLIRNHTRSCGCLAREHTKSLRYIHGGTGTSEFSSWRRMMARCTDQRDMHYSDYGGRGITVCARWHDFPSFLADMGKKPYPDYTIERDDVNGNYEPGNCRWIPRSEQGNNTRQCHFLEHDGKKLNIMQWAKVTGLPHWVITKRIKLGWSVERTLITSVRTRSDGEMNGSCKVNAELIKSIREMRSRGVSTTDLVTFSGLSRSQLLRVINRQSWKTI